jgi:deoxycytidine triphosphate deaminase
VTQLRHEVAKPAGAALLASIQHRARALSLYLHQLPSVHGPDGDSHRAAAAQLGQIVDGVYDQGERELDRAVDDEDAINRLRPLLGYLVLVVDRVDQILARVLPEIPTSLIRAVQNELENLSVKNVLPLLTIGPPGNYETGPFDLWDTVYSAPTVPGLQSATPPVRIFSVPLVEGSRALWMPIAVGHEVAHIAIKHYQLIEKLPIENWITQDDVADVEIDNSLWPEIKDDVLAAAQRVLTLWVVEIMCDLQSVRRFGPAGVAAQCDFLASIAADSSAGWGTHPPPWYRAKTMLSAVASASDVFAPIIDAWTTWAAAVETTGDPLTVAILSVLTAHQADLIAALELLPGTAYDPSTRAEVVTELVEWLRRGIAGRENIAGLDVLDADVLNAGWAARLQDDFSRKDPSHLDTLDALVAKSLDIGDFLTLWNEFRNQEARDDPEGETQPDAREPVQTVEHGSWSARGVISEQEIYRRLELGRNLNLSQAEDVQRLIITPETSLNVAGSSLDLRLGRGFITFRRSSTAAFDVLSDVQDPREMQEFVEKDWGDDFILHPGELVLASTLEYIAMPSDLTAQVITRSSFGRLGLLSATAVQVQPCFTGCLTLELLNFGQMPLTLAPGERVAQLVFAVVDPPVRQVRTKYSYPIGPQFSMISSDADVKILRAIRHARDKRRTAFASIKAGPGASRTFRLPQG